MRIERRIVLMVAVLACAGLSAAWAATDRVVGIMSSEANTTLLKYFSVPEGSVISGVKFVNNDERTVFPRVAVLQGPATKLAEASVLAEATNVRAQPGHRVEVAFDAVQARSSDIYVAVLLPPSTGVRGKGDGAGIGGNLASGLTQSYIVPNVDEPFQRIDVDLAIELITQGSGKVLAEHSTDPYGAAVHEPQLLVTTNPVVESAELKFDVGQPGQVSLKIYDIAGREVRSLVEETLIRGQHTRHWDGRRNGERVSRGIYLARLQVGDQVVTRKLVFAR